MKFHILPRQRGHANPIVYETDEICIQVGELSPERGKWVFHHHHTSAALKKPVLDELCAWAKDQVTVMKLTQRMLK